jgi:GT2 family glycosyltransferase
MNDLNNKEREKISKYVIVIAVTHSIDCLRECLRSLERLDYSKQLFQVALIDCHVLNGLKAFFDADLKDYRCRITALSLPGRPRKHEDWLHESRLNEARNDAMDQVPGHYFVFTEDDCMFEPDWLTNFDRVLSDDLGAAGGPDILPDGMGWLPRALDSILNSFLGTAGAKKGDGISHAWYYPRKENTVIPATVIKRVGNFPENMIFGGEMEMAKRIRDAGLQIIYVPDNPVWHRRDTTFRNFIRRNRYHAAEKVRLLRTQRVFSRSPHFLVFLSAAAGLAIGVLSMVNGHARSLFFALIAVYFGMVLLIAASSFIRTRSVSVGLGVVLLLPFHHFSIMAGVVKGAASKIAD